jgi:hypothetical protein
MRFDPIGLLSKLLEKIGIDTYLKRCEFSAHLGWGCFFGSLGHFVHWAFFIAWTVFVLYDEFYCDKHWKVFVGDDPEWPDLCYDLASKLAGIIIFFIIR